MEGDSETPMQGDTDPAMQEATETAVTTNEEGILIFPEKNDCRAASFGETIETADGPKPT